MSLIARESELGAVENALGTGPLLTIAGPGGVGKTTLARAALRRRPGLFCALAGCTTREEALSAVATVLEVRWRRGADRAGQLTSQLRKRGRVLLVLDNAEHLIDETAALMAAWLADCPEARFLVTSRERLHIAGETVLELPPLSTRTEAGPSDAARLFLARAAAVRPGYTPGADLATIERVVARLDGIPLAIELAAARMRVFSPVGIAERLDQRFTLLVGHRRDVDERHRTLRNALDWSFRLLDPKEQLALRQLTVFRGGFRLEAAEAVLAMPDGAVILESLRDKSLLYADAEAKRFDLYESVRAYAAEQIDPDAPATARRHGLHYVELASALAASLRGPDGASARARLSEERDNLLAVCRRVEQPDLARSALLGLAELLLYTEAPGAHLGLFDAALADSDGDPALRGRLHLARARLRDRIGRSEEAELDCTAALAASEQAVLRVEVLTFLTTLRYMRGELGLAVDTGAEAVALAGPDVPARLAADAASEHACALHMAGRLDEARAGYTAALAAWRACGDRDGEARSLAAQGFLLQDRGELGEAERAYAEALAIFRALGNEASSGIVLGYQGNLARRRGDLEAARARYRDSLELLRRVGDRQFETAFTVDECLLLVEHRLLDEAERRLGEARLVLAETPQRQIEALARGLVAVTEAMRDRRVEAEASMAAAEALGGAGDPIDDTLHLLRGHVELAQARLEPSSAPILLDRARARVARYEGACRTDYVAIAHRMLSRALLRAAPPCGSLTVAEDGSAFELDGQRVDLASRPALGRLLRLLTERAQLRPGTSVTPEELLATGWPGERVAPDAGRNRLRVAMTTLRNLGLRPVLRSDKRGYSIDPTRPIALSASI